MMDTRKNIDRPLIETSVKRKPSGLSAHILPTSAIACQRHR